MEVVSFSRSSNVSSESCVVGACSASTVKRVRSTNVPCSFFVSLWLSLFLWPFSSSSWSTCWEACVNFFQYLMVASRLVRWWGGFCQSCLSLWFHCHCGLISSNVGLPPPYIFQSSCFFELQGGQSWYSGQDYRWHFLELRGHRPVGNVLRFCMYILTSVPLL